MIGRLLVALSLASTAFAAPKLTAEIAGDGSTLTVRRDGEVIIAGEPGLGLSSALFYDCERGRESIGHVLMRDPLPGGGQSYTLVTQGGKTAAIVTIEPGDPYLRIVFRLDDTSQSQRLGLSYRLPTTEHIHGLTERVRDGGDWETWGWKGPVKLDRRGDKVNMWVTPTVSMYTPFYLTSRGYGVFVKTTWPGEYDLCSTDPDVLTLFFEGPQLELHIYPGPTVPDVLDQYTQDTGRPCLPPRWAFGVWRWRDEHKNPDTLYDGSPNPSPYNSQVYEDVMMFEKYNIPCSVYWIDRPWAKGKWGFDDFDPDPDRLPNFDEMVRWLNGKGMEVLLWTAPRVRGERNATAKERGYLAPNSAEILDFTNPEAIRWEKSGFGAIVSRGIAGFKLDRSEEIVPSNPEDIYHDGRSGREVHNLYPYLYAKLYNEGLSERREDFIVLPRAGFAGSQKYAAFWGGDTSSDWQGLRSVVISAQRVGLMGMPVWGSDTGGYQRDPNREVFARWLAVSCFHPIMEVGGNDAHAPWDMAFHPRFDEELIEIYRYYATLHTLLGDYTHTYARTAHESGRPIVRPLFYHFPDDERAWTQWDEWMYGEDILVAAIWTEGKRGREVYLPEGTWVDYWDESRTVTGPTTEYVECPLHKIPIYLREGSRVPVRHKVGGPAAR